MKLTGFEKVSADRSMYELEVKEGEIGLSDYKALVGICRARITLMHVPFTNDVSQAITDLERKLPPSGTPLARQVWAAAHAHYNEPNTSMIEHYAARDFSDPLEREGKPAEGQWPAV